MKTRVAYAIGKNNKQYRLCDTVHEALKKNMMVSDFEKNLIENNKNLNIVIKIEGRR